MIAADINRDGKTDLYVANDIWPNFLFLNRGAAFEEVGAVSGVAFDGNGNAQAGMGVDLADVNHDGRFDLIVTNFEKEYNTLYIQLPTDEVAFADRSVQSKIAASSLPWIGWGVAFRDFDQDGEDDVFVVNGHVDSNLADLHLEGTHEEPPVIWRRMKNIFQDVSSTAGSYFVPKHSSRGLIVGDYDGDGDWDAAISNQDHPPAFLSNESVEPEARSKKSLRIKLIGVKSNRDAIGATVVVHEGENSRTYAIASGGSYASSPERVILIARAADSLEGSVEVYWPSGAKSTIPYTSDQRSLVIVENQ